MITTTRLLDDFAVTDWTALDYAMSTHPVYVDLAFKGCIFRQVINTRHLSLLFTNPTSFTPPSQTLSVPKLDYSCTSEFYNLLESELLHLTHNQLLTAPTNSTSFVAYTDGSCPGFAAYTSTSPFDEHLEVTSDWIISYGMVKTAPLDVNVIAPLDGSKSTGEMKSIIELFDYIFSHLLSGSEVRVFIDSQYVIRSLLGDQLPSTHHSHQLVELAQQYFTALRTNDSVQLVKVSSHIGIPGNELADALAKRGVSTYGSLGRFSFPRTRSLSTPEIGYNSDRWLSKTPQEQSEFLSSSIEKHVSVIPILPVSPKKPWISSRTLLLITDFQQALDLSPSEIKQCRKRIKKSATKDKKEFISSHLQADFHGSSAHQWRTARSIRTPFSPRPVNLYNIHGKLTSKHMRTTTVAEYLSEKVWKAPDELGEIPIEPPPTDCGSFFLAWEN